jgi:hypothetical protein
MNQRRKERPRTTRMDVRRRGFLGEHGGVCARNRGSGKASHRGPGRGLGFCGVRLIPEIPEAETNPEILAPQELDHCLKFVSLFAGHPDLSILDLALNLGV